MDDFNPLLYKKLTDYIESGCQQQNIKRDYVEYLFSMEQAESIEQLIKIYNNIFKLLAVIYYGGKNVPYNWYIYECWGYEMCEIVQQLSQYLNDNILRWLKRQGFPTREKVGLAIINLRECRNTGYIERKIFNIEGEGAPPNCSLLSTWRDQHHRQLLEVNKLNNSKRYLNSLIDYKRYSMFLSSNGYIFDVIEESFATQHNIDYKELESQYYEELVHRESERERRQKEQEEIEKKNQRYAESTELINSFSSEVGGFLLSLPFAFLGGIWGASKKK